MPGWQRGKEGTGTLLRVYDMIIHRHGIMHVGSCMIIWRDKAALSGHKLNRCPLFSSTTHPPPLLASEETPMWEGDALAALFYHKPGASSLFFWPRYLSFESYWLSFAFTFSVLFWTSDFLVSYLRFSLSEAWSREGFAPKSEVDREKRFKEDRRDYGVLQCSEPLFTFFRTLSLLWTRYFATTMSPEQCYGSWVTKGLINFRANFSPIPPLREP